MSPMNRRQAVKLIAVTPALGILEWTPEETEKAALQIGALVQEYEPKVFNAHEWRTVHVLVDLIIPRDERSGSATDAKVPEFMDFMLSEGSENRRRTMKQGLEWLDGEMTKRFNADFITASDEQRKQVLDDIAWPARAPEGMNTAVSFFNSFRDLTASGFFSSKMGFEDLQYKGREFVAAWNGCPEPALRKLGVSYDVMEVRR